MVYISQDSVKTAFDALKDKVDNGFWGVLGILNCIQSDQITSNITQVIKIGEVSKWLDEVLFLSKYEGSYDDASLYVKFSKKWETYVKKNLLKERVNIYAVVAFIYKSKSFENELSKEDLINKFATDFHLTLENLSDWFEKTPFDLSFTTTQFDKTLFKQSVSIANNTISFNAPYSVVARAGEISRAPFMQTLYAGMDSIKVLLLLKDNIEEYYATETRKSNNIEQLLASALHLFKERRGEDKWRDGDYKGVNTSVRSYFDGLNETTIRAFDANAFKDFCCEHTWSGTNGTGWAQLSQSDFSKCAVFFADLKSRPQLPSAYWRGDVERPRGVGNALISELLMKFHPQNFGLYNSRSHNTLVWLGLMEGGFESKFSADQYAQAQGMLSMIRQKMWTLKIGKTLEEESGDADFISVNEFLWFVDNNKDVIKESIMKTQLKTVEPKPMLGGKELELADNPLMLRLMAALRTKPFAILAGHSGTGKSRMVRKLAYMTCCDEKLRGGDKPGNFCMIQVKPNWHDSTDLLGYYSALSQRYETTEFVKFICKAYAYPHVPFFVCLDEMNLAPVEQYFAEYLSAIESAKDDNGIRTTDTLIAKDVYGTALDLGVESKNAADWIEAHGLTIPKNLFVVGTVNMDETTCQFSRKVLDRAMTLEMNAVNFETFGTTDHEPSFADTLKVDEVVKLLGGKAKAGGLTADQKSKLTVLTGALEFTPFVVAYRFANEYALYTESLALFNGGDEKVAFDHLVLMKILPRILGEREMVNSLFGDSSKGLKGLFGESGTKALSVVKMDEILQRKESYLSFWP